MTISFLRLVVPTYFGGLPSGYGYINNATSGVPANASGVLTGPSVNAGSYFVGFDDDGTSANVNRPAQALATNTDFLDDLLRQDLAFITRTADVGPTGSLTTTITLTGPNIWMGNSGGYLLRDLFHIVDSNDQDITVSGTQVVVASFTGGSVGGGFSTGSLVLTLNIPIPIGTTYHVYYGSRTNLATLPMDALTLPFLRDEGSVSANIAAFVAQVSAPGVLGTPVTALEAYSFSTPYGALAASSSFFLDCDPTDSGAATRQYSFRSRQQSVGRIVAKLTDDPTSTLLPGLTGLLAVDTGVAIGSVGTALLTDANIQGGIGTGMDKLWPLTSASSALGDQFPRLFEKAVTSAALGSAVAPSLMRYINGRWCCTIGDGTVSFGDFSGAGSFDAALAYAASLSLVNLHIQVKAGNYNWTVSHNFAGDILIEGVSLGQVVLTTNVSTTSIALVSSGHLALRDLVIAFGSNAGCQLTVDTAAVDMSRVFLNGISLVSTNGLSYGPFPPVLCRECEFAPSVANAPFSTYAVQLFVNDGGTHTGFIFEDCVWTCHDETGPVTVVGGGSTQSLIGGIVFRDCRYTLGGTATTGGHITTNTGVLYVNPNGTSQKLLIVDVTWDNCYPSGNVTSSANGVLARVHPLATGATSETNIATIYSVTIRGGIWACNDVNTTYSQFLIAAQRITVEDVTFYNGGSVNGGPSSEDQFVIGGSAHSVQDWAQFIFATGALSVAGEVPAPNTLTLRDIQFNSSISGSGAFTSLSNAGDLWLYAIGRIAVDGVSLTGYVTAGGGPDLAPNARVRVTPAPAITFGPSPVLSGYIRGLSLHGFATYSAPFTNTANFGQAGLVLFEPCSSDSAVHLSVEGLVIDGFAYSGTADDGIVLVNPPTVGPLRGCHFKTCRVLNMHYGLAMYGVGTSGSGGNGQALDDFSIEGGTYEECFQGITLSPDFVGEVVLRDVRTSSNTDGGVIVRPNSWATTAGPSVLTMTGCASLGDNSGGGIGIFLGSNVGSPHLVLKGNSVLTSAGALSSIEIATGAGASLPSGAQPGLGGFFIYGAHTGISSVGATPLLLYSSTGQMMENMALLVTP